MSQAKIKLYALLLFIIALVVSVFILNGINKKWQQLRQHDIENLIHTHALSMEESVNRALATARVLAAWLKSNGGNTEHFDLFAQELIEATGGITNLQLAPKGIVQYIYPLAGHEKAMGHNILQDDNRRNEAKLAILSNKLTLAGPFELKQGGVAIIGRQPIFVDKIAGKDSKQNKHYFWGFASTLISLETLIMTSSLNELDNRGDFFQLWRNHPDTGEKDIFYSNVDGEVSEQFHETIELPNAIWHLNIEENHQFFHNPELWSLSIILFLLDVFLSYSFYHYLKERSSRKGTDT